MILKSADDKSKRIALLEELQRSALLDAYQRNWLSEELERLRKGIQGERDSAHYLDNYFKNGQNHVVMHDLRFVVDGDVAQIDHLIINRAVGFYLIETKNYAGNLVINEHGEFTAEYGRVRFGIESPLEQSRRHERVLARLLERLEIVGRTQKQPDFHHVVMMHPKAIIQRPVAAKFDTSNVIKADQFPTWHGRYVEGMGIGVVLKSALNMRSIDTVKEWAERLKREHRAADFLSLPDFMRPRPPTAAATSTVNRVPQSPATGMPATTSESKAIGDAPVSSDKIEKKLICAACGNKISYAEGKFCWNSSKRFNGLQYCREHQALF
jgi:hypothetical protein